MRAFTGNLRIYNDNFGTRGRNTLTVNITANSPNYVLSFSTLPGYIIGITDVVLSIATGIYVYSTGTGTAAITCASYNTGDGLKIVNRGYIMGQGGTGGSNGVSGGVGGPAISLAMNTIIDNTYSSAYIGGGGGGGASGTNAGGGGAGGGASGSGFYGPSGTPGGPGVAGTGWAGGRIFPGSTPGQAGGNGSGAAGGTNNNPGGDSWNGSPYSSPAVGGGGGGWGAAGGNAYVYAFGAGGKAVALNSKTVTWVAGDTTRVWGAVS